MSKGNKSEIITSINIVETIDHLSRSDLIKLITESKEEISKQGIPFPNDPWMQLLMCIESGFRSTNNPWAKQYRIIHNLPHDSGISIIVQAMVFGNMNSRSGSGAMYTRDRNTGENKMNGEFMQIAEGDEYIGTIDSSIQAAKFDLLAQEMSPSYSKLIEIKNLVEKEFRNMQQIDFTIESGNVYVLNTHDSKRSPIASVKIAVDMVSEEIINERQAIKSLDIKELDFFRQSMISSSIDLNELNRKFCGKGTVISAGCVAGKVAFTLAEVLELKTRGEKVIYCFTEITKDDIKIFGICDGIISLIPAHDYLISFYAPSLPPTINNFTKFSKQNLAENGESKDDKQSIKFEQTLTVDATTGNYQHF